MAFDFANKVRLRIPEGMVKQIADSAGNVIWKRGYVNQVRLSTDTDGSIYNGVGYKDNTRMASNGSISPSAQTGSVATGYMPFIGGDACVIRIKGGEWFDAYTNHGGHYYLSFYDTDKNYLGYITSAQYVDFDHIMTATRDANGVETIVWNQSYGTTNAMLQYVRTQVAYFRINVYGKGEDLIITVNEEIE